ncbi:MAG TPA: glycosyltransferase [Caldithrix abyssi]|uniref:Glycosyltransferase n=1 Tax=Caldithrix abyssi TaxID=187145 RepID=A0A7V5UER4_CALAY|nr:glycosyltransferase [Caldithrix abyssi]
MDWILWLFGILTVGYFAVLLLVLFSFFRLQNNPQGVQPTVSVVVAAKNESARLLPLLRSLEKLEYPPDRYEVIFVDDASNDDTPQILANAAQDKPNWRFLRVEQQSDKFHAKKTALATGVRAAKGEVIFVTDADCRVPPKWLSAMAARFDPQTAMVLGYSPLENKTGFLDKWLKFDNLFSAVTVMAPTVWGFPISSVGRNMAFRKSAYEQIGGYEALTRFKSGDDIHLTERMRDHRVGKIKACVHPDAFVYTQPPETGREIIFQQIRKNSKILDKSPISAGFSVLLFAAYLLFYTLPLFDAGYLTLWAVVFGAKFLLEFVDLTVAARTFRVTELVPWFPLFQIVYPFYVMVLGLIGFLHLYRWK